VPGGAAGCVGTLFVAGELSLGSTPNVRISRLILLLAVSRPNKFLSAKARSHIYALTRQGYIYLDMIAQAGVSTPQTTDLDYYLEATSER